MSKLSDTSSVHAASPCECPFLCLYKTSGLLCPRPRKVDAARIRSVQGMAVPQPDTREFLKTSHELAKWMIQLADTKASILMASSAILAGLLSQLSVTTCNI